MKIKKARNTPILTNLLFYSNNISNNVTGIKRNAIINIDSDISLFTDKSNIKINTTSISYSDLGFLYSPTMIKTETHTFIKSNNLNQNTLKFYSILELEPNLEHTYNKINEIICKSINSKDFVIKETYEILAIQLLSNFSIKLSENISLMAEKLFSKESLIAHNIVSNICISFSKISKSLKLLTASIGKNHISLNNSHKISQILLSVVNTIDSIIKETISNKSIQADEFIVNSLSLQVFHCRKLLTSKKTEICISYFISSIQELLDLENLILNTLITYIIPMSNISLSVLINSLKNNIKILKLNTDCISLSYSNLSKNYNLIIDNIKHALINSKNILLIKNKYTLYQNLNFHFTNLNSYSKYLDTTNTKNFSNQNSYIITESIKLNLSFYIRNLIIKINGTIGSKNFTGHIHYPHLYNLTFFHIDNSTINTKVTIPSEINAFDFKIDVDPTIEIKDIIIRKSYSLEFPYSFIADIKFSFSVNSNLYAIAKSQLVIRE